MKRIERSDSNVLQFKIGDQQNEFSSEDERNKTTSSIYEDKNGRLWIDCRAARLGPMVYRNQDGSATTEVHLPEDLFSDQTRYSAFGIPITIEHPTEGEVTSYTHKVLAVGNVMYPAKIDEDYFLRMRLQIFDKDVSQEIIQKINNQEKWDVSCGYSADLEEKPGDYNGSKYDGIHRNIIYNHLSLVSKGRAGSEVGILEQKDSFDWN